MPTQDNIRPWTETLIPELPENATDQELLTFIACAARRQLEISMPRGARLIHGEVIVLD